MHLKTGSKMNVQFIYVYVCVLSEVPFKVFITSLKVSDVYVCACVCVCDYVMKESIICIMYKYIFSFFCSVMPQCSWWFDFDFSGGDFQMIPNTASAQDCNTHCLGNPTCNHWAWGAPGHVFQYK